MAFGYDSISLALQASFPASAAGNLADTEYSILDLDATGGPSVIVAYTNVDVIEVGNGAYAVTLNLPEGHYSILWRIVGTPFVSAEEINIYQNIYEEFAKTLQRYNAYGIGAARLGSFTGASINLGFQFTINLEKVPAYSVTKVEIFDNYDEAVIANPGDVLQTITSFTHGGTGNYSYVMSAVSVSNVYFDRITLIPEMGGTPVHFIFPVFVASSSLPITPTSKEVASIFLDIYDITDTPQKGEKVFVSMINKYAIYNNCLIEREAEVFVANNVGHVSMTLIETDTLNNDTGVDVYYEATALQDGFKKLFKIPSGTGAANLLSLPDYIPPEE